MASNFPTMMMPFPLMNNSMAPQAAFKPQMAPMPTSQAPIALPSAESDYNYVPRTYSYSEQGVVVAGIDPSTKEQTYDMVPRNYKYAEKGIVLDSVQQAAPRPLNMLA
jgi:hypothetical protein